MAEFDGINPLVEGVDPTATWGAYATQLLQMVREAQPGTLYGFVIYSYSTPPTTGIQEWHKRCIWVKIPTSPATEYFVYYYDANAGSFDNLKNVIDFEILDGSIGIAKLDPSEGSALQIIRKNAANTAYEHIDLADALEEGSVLFISLEPAAGPGYVAYSITDGVWSASLWSTLFDASLAAAELPVAQLKDVAGSGSLDQVLRLASTTTKLFTFEYVDQLLRANQVTTDRIDWSNFKGKYLKGNALGTDLEGVTSIPTSSTLSAAVYKYTAAAGTAGQSISADTTTVVQFSEAVDLDSIATIDGFYEVELSTGTYTFDIAIPVRYTPGTMQAVALLYDVTASNTIIATGTCAIDSETDDTWIHIKHAVKITGSTNKYKVSIHASEACTLGASVVAGGLPQSAPTFTETYQQWLITKIA